MKILIIIEYICKYNLYENLNAIMITQKFNRVRLITNHTLIHRSAICPDIGGS